MKTKNPIPKTLAVWLLAWVCPPTTLLQAQSSEQTGAQWLIPRRDAALQHLNSVMDQYHLTFDVYTDVSTAGNHFTLLGKMAAAGDENRVSIDFAHLTSPFSGSSCIRCSFLPRPIGRN